MSEVFERDASTVAGVEVVVRLLGGADIEDYRGDVGAVCWRSTRALVIARSVHAGAATRRASES